MSTTRILLVVVPAIALAACSSKKPGPPACSDPGTQITFDAPKDQDFLSTDGNPDVPGFQTRLQVHTDLADGTVLPLTINGIPDSSQLTVTGGKIDQEITLVTGENSLSFSKVVCDRTVSAAATITVAPNGCAFVSPFDNQKLKDADDNDTNKPGVQLDVRARCDKGAGDAVELQVNHAHVAAGTFGTDSSVTFAAQSLYAGDAELELIAKDGTTVLATARTHVEQTGACAIGLDPAPLVMFNLTGEQGDALRYPQFIGDVDPATAGIQADVHVTASCSAGAEAQLLDVNGTVLGSANFTTGVTTIRINVPNGAFGVFPVVHTTTVNWPGNPVGYNGDAIRPSCKVDAPADGGDAEDADPSTPPVDFHVKGSCTGLDAGTDVRLVFDDQPVAMPAQKLGTDLTYDFATQVAVAGKHTVQVTGFRPSGNSTQDKGNSFVAGVPDCAIQTPVDGSATNLQPVAVKVKSNVDPGTPIVVTVIDPDGTTRHDLAAASATPAPSGGTSADVQAPLTALDGIYEIDARCGSTGQATPVKLELDTKGPQLVVTVPNANGVINTSIADADASTPGFDSAVTVTADSIQNGSTTMVSVACAPSGFTATAAMPAPFATNVATTTVSLAGAVEGDTCTFTATATDAAGNAASNVVPALATFDRTGPVFVSHTPSSLNFSLVSTDNPGINGSLVLGNEIGHIGPTLSFQFDTTGGDGGSFSLVDVTDAVVLFQTVTPAGGHITATAVGMPAAQGKTVTIEAHAQDPGGNTTILTYTANVDVIDPEVIASPALAITDARTAKGTLSFGAPSGDLGGVQTATSYDVRWSNVPIPNDGAFAAAEQIQVAKPAAPATAENLTVKFPPFGIKYVCVRPIDWVGNRSAFSCASATKDWSSVTFATDQASTNFGFHIVGVGDVTGDGFGDFVATERGRVTGGVNAGALQVFCGGADLSAALAAPCATLAGTVAGERCGEHLASGDFDGDGIQDVVMGCNAYGTNQGRAFLYFGTGKAGGYSSAASVELRGTTSPAAQFGASLASLGDIDGDGTDDLYVGAYAEGANGPGSGYVFFGRSQAKWATVAGQTQTLAGGPADSSITNVVHFEGDNNGDLFGYRYGAGPVGDLDGDGLPEFAIPESAQNRLFVFNATAATKAAGIVHATDALTTVTDKARALPNAPLYAGLGHRSLAGDFTGDSFPDLIVADPNNARVDVFPGDKANATMKSTPTETFKEPAFGISSNLGYDLAVADVNGDGNPDLAVGSNGTLTNTVFLYLGTGLAGDQPFDPFGSRLTGPAGSLHGTGVVLEDLNKDGHVDVIVGAEFETPRATVHVYISP